jgi:hypothetical protein
MISWVLIRRRYVTRRQTELFTVSLLINNTIPAIGFLVSPIFVFWILSITTIHYSPDLYIPQAKVEATREANLLLTPLPTRSTGDVISYTPTPIIPRPVEEIAYDMSGHTNAVIGFLIGGLIVYLIIGGAFQGCIYHLMPVVYSDMDVGDAVPSVTDKNANSIGQTK